MARIVKEEEYNAKRNAILDATQQLVETKGYEQMAIQDILDALQISKGAFYHYFDSKPALLLALVERRGEQLEQLLLPILHDPTLSALDKLQRYFTMHNRFKLEHKQLVFEVMRIWYADENAIVRHKLSVESRKRLVPWLAQIIGEGIAGGTFTTSYPDQVASMIISLLEDMGNAIVELLLAEERAISDIPQIARIAEATADALERVLGAQPGCMQASWREALSLW